MYQYNEITGFQGRGGFNRSANTSAAKGQPFATTSTNSSPFPAAYSNLDYMQTFGANPHNGNSLEVQQYRSANSTPTRNLQQSVLNFNGGAAAQNQIRYAPFGRADQQNRAFFTVETKRPNGNANRVSTNDLNSGARLNVVKREAKPAAMGGPKAKVVKREEKSATKKNNESMRIFTGNAEKIIKWNKKQKNYFCLYELYASIVNIQTGSVRLQQIMLLRDKKGPIIQVVHYINDHINLENFFVGQMLRCVGRMIGPNIMHAVSIREATEEEIFTLQRISYICDDAVSKSTKG